MIVETFTAGIGQATGFIHVDLASTPTVYPVAVDSGPADQTVPIQTQLDAIPDGTPSSPNIIRFPAGRFHTEGNLAANPRGAAGVFRFTNRHHLILEGPSREDPAVFYTSAPAVPWGAKVDLNQQSLRRHFWFRNCTGITVRDSIRVEGSNYTYADQLAPGVPAFWEGPPDNGGTPLTRGYRAGWELEHAFAFDACSDVSFAGQVRDVWGDGVYFGSLAGVGCSNVYVGACQLDGTGRQGIAVSAATDVLMDGFTIGTSTLRPRRAGIDLEPVLQWVIDRVEIRNFTMWMGNMTAVAALGSSRVDHVYIHDGTVPTGTGGKCQVGASNGVQRKDWTLRDLTFAPFGSPQPPLTFTGVDGVTVDNVEVAVAASQSRRVARFIRCNGELSVVNGRWGAGLWVDHLDSTIPMLAGNTPTLTLRNQ